MRWTYDDYFRNARSMLENDHGKEKFRYHYVMNYDEDNPEEYRQLYNNNMAHSCFITENQWEKIMEYTNAHNYYNVAFNNCVEVAYNSWNYAMPVEKRIVGSTFSKLEKIYLCFYKDSHVFDLYQVLNIRL